MATKTWNSADAAFTTAADWSGGVAPVAGDVAVINAGTVSVGGTLPVPLTINVTSSSSSPVLALSGTTIAAGDRVVVTGGGPDASLQVSGTVVNRGSVTLAGSSPVIRFVDSTGVFDNEGGLSVVGTGSIVTSSSNTVVNNGTVSFRNSGTAVQADSFLAGLSGTGMVRLSGNVQTSLLGPVSAGQTVVFEPGNEALGLGVFSAFLGTIAGFDAGDVIAALTDRWVSDSFTRTGTGGVLTFTTAAGTSSSLNFTGNYQSLSDFTINQQAGMNGFARTTIQTSVAAAPVRVTFTDTMTDVAGSDAASVYTGPVSYLQYEYLWSGTDDVVIGASVNNVFLHGGVGNDALVAVGGSNVLDGGGGSNFLVGASGSDGGKDTFFVDERGGQVTWSTLLNFHAGDAVTIFGFKGGVSTLPFVDNDGTPGYTGATLHSEIGGAGTGVNGSVTFAGVSLAQFNADFSTSSGTVGGTDYLYITRNS